MLAALVLAAGASTRMGSPKALLRDAEGRPFVARLVRAFAAAGVVDVLVVTGDSHEAVAEALETDRPPVVVRVVRNDDPARGQLSSLWTGLAAVDCPTLQGVLVTPVDVPMIAVSTIAAVIEAWRGSRAPVVRPVMGGRHGHPVLFDRVAFDQLRRAPLDRGAKAVVRAHASAVVNVPVDDEGCLIDVDTPEDYSQLIIAPQRRS